MGTIIKGEVVGGNKIGRMLGFPTANIVIGEELELRNGVYSACATVDGVAYDAIVNLGHKPSIGSNEKRVLEANIFDFDRNIYNQIIEVELLDYIREERTFASLEALRMQIDADKKMVKNKFNK